MPLFDAALALALATAAVLDTAETTTVPHPWAEIFAAGTMLFLALRTRAPMVMGLGSSLSFVGFVLCRGTSTPMWAFLGILVIGFSTGAHLRGRRRGLVLAVEVAATYVVQIVTAARLDGQLTAAEVYLTPLVIVLAPALAGMLLQRSRDQTVRISQLARELAVQRERDSEAAAQAERTRIARELHDVISHSVTVMVVQAGAAEQLLSPDNAAYAPVRALRETGKEALQELRRQLGVLGSADVGVGPLPRLADLPRLVERAGGVLDLESAADPDLASGLEVAVFRVVQEALTNVARHAAGAIPEVAVRRRVDGIEVEVVDRGGRPSQEPGSGRGLVGMRERVELYAGVLDAGPHRGGWRVHAWFPAPVETRTALTNEAGRA